MLQHDQDLERKLILKTGIDKNYTSEKTFYFRVRLEQIKVAEYKLHRTLQHSKVFNVFSTTKGHLTAPHQTASEPQLLSVA